MLSTAAAGEGYAFPRGLGKRVEDACRKGPLRRSSVSNCSVGRVYALLGELFWFMQICTAQHLGGNGSRYDGAKSGMIFLFVTIQTFNLSAAGDRAICPRPLLRATKSVPRACIVDLKLVSRVGPRGRQEHAGRDRVREGVFIRSLFVAFWSYPGSMRFILAGATNPDEPSFGLRIYPSVAVFMFLWRRGGGAAAAAAARARRRW